MYTTETPSHSDTSLVTKKPQEASSLTIIQRIAWWIIGGIIIAPLVYYPGIPLVYNQFDVPRRLLYFLATGLLLSVIVLSWAIRRRITFRYHPLDLFVGLFVLGALISGLFAPNPSYSLLAPLWYHDLDIVPAVILGVAAYWGIKEFLGDDRERLRLITGILAIGTLVAIIGLLETPFKLLHLLAHPQTRLASTLDNPMFTGLYLAMLLPLGIGVAMASTTMRQKIVVTICTAILAFALLFTLTRGAWLGAAGALLLVFGIAQWGIRPPMLSFTRIQRLITIIILGCLVLLVIFQPTIRSRMKTMVHFHDPTVRTRLVAIETAGRMFLSHPLHGVGPGYILYLHTQYRPSSTLSPEILSVFTRDTTSLPHNVVMQVAASMGLLGLLPFLLLIGAIYHYGLRCLHSDTCNRWLVLGVLGLLSAYFFTSLFAFDMSATLIHCWIGLALFASFKAKVLSWGSSTTSQGWSLWLPIFTGIVGIGLAMGTLTLFITQAYATSLTFGAARALAGSYGARRAQHWDQVAQDSQTAVENLQTAIALTPVRDFWLEELLAWSYQPLTQSSASPSTRKTAQKAMFEIGERSLYQLPQNPRLLVLLAVEYQKAGRLADARRITDELLACHPQGVRAAILNATQFEREGNIPEAVAEAKRALQLDSASGEARAAFAHGQLLVYQGVMAQRGDPREDPLLHEIAQNYQQATTNWTLTLEQRQEYATVLFFIGRVESAIATAKPLRHTPNFEELCQRIALIAKTYQRTADGQHMIQALQMDER